VNGSGLLTGRFFPVFRVKKMQLSEHSEFCIFSEKAGRSCELAVASCQTARRAFLLTFFAGKKVWGMVKKTEKNAHPKATGSRKSDTFSVKNKMVRKDQCIVKR
jgi:hypothetical protein